VRPSWVGRAAFLLRPVHERLLARLKGPTKLFADETTARRCSIPDAGRPRPANCGLRTRRSPLGWRRPAWRGVCLRPRSQGGAADRPSSRVHGHPSGRIRSLGWKSVPNFAEIKPEVELLFGSRLKRFVRYLMSLNETSGAPRLPKLLSMRYISDRHAELPG
jgi:hypothetical protein